MQALTEAISRAAASAAPPDFSANGGKALMLVGSFARGEGTAIRSGDGIEILGDVEFLAVFDDRASFARIDRITKAWQEALQSELRGAGIRCEVDMHPAWDRYFRTMSPGIFSAELCAYGRRLRGDLEFERARVKPPSVPARDGLFMLGNRTVELLDRWRSPAAAEDDPMARIREYYFLVKLWLDVLTVCLVIEREFRPSYGGRLERLDLLDSVFPFGGPGKATLGRARRNVRDATRFKRSGVVEAGDALRSLEEIFPDGYPAERRRVAQALLALWDKAVARVVGRNGFDVMSVKDRWEASVRLVGASFEGRSRSWLRLLVHARREGVACDPLRALRLARIGTPKALIYVVAAGTLALAARDEHLDTPVGREPFDLLPGSFRRPPTRTTAGLADELCANWAHFVRGK